MKVKVSVFTIHCTLYTLQYTIFYNDDDCDYDNDNNDGDGDGDTNLQVSQNLNVSNRTANCGAPEHHLCFLIISTVKSRSSQLVPSIDDNIIRG